MSDVNIPGDMDAESFRRYGHQLVEWIADYRTVGDGMGGTREDSGYQVINARI